VLTVFGKMTNSLLPNYLAEKIKKKKFVIFFLDTHLWLVASEIHVIVTGHFVEI